MIRKVLNGQILNTQTKNITLASFILGAAYFISALLGLLRDRLLAGRFGASDELDIYYAAFRIPDFIAMILVMGSISAAIVPVFSDYLIRSKKEAWEFLSNLLNLFLFSLIIICVLLIIFTPQLISLIVPGFSDEKKDLTVFLTRIMFLSPILLGISNVISGILFVFRRFLVTSLSPIMYNIGIIFGIIFLVPIFGAKGLAFGVVLGGVFHLLIQCPVLFKLGFRPQKIFNFFHPGFLKTVRLTIPRTFGLIASQINLIVITGIGSTLAVGSIAVLNLADNIQNLPITFIAVSFSTAAFPFLAVYFSKQNKEKFIEKFSSMFRQIIFLMIPISILIFILRAQIIRIILGTGKFGWIDTRLTAACLGIFSFGILAYGLSLFISKTFYALQNTKTPAFVSFFTVTINIGLCFLFVWLMKFENPFQKFIIDFLDLYGIKNSAMIGLPLALSISGILQVFLLLMFLYREIGDFKIKEILKSLKNILIASILMIFVTYFSLRILAGLVNMQSFWGIFVQTVLAGVIGIAIYILISLLFKSSEIKTIRTCLATLGRTLIR